jgi:predicted permease
MAFGFAIGRSGRMDVGDARVINRFALSVLLPMFLFKLAAGIDVGAFEFLPLLAYLGAEIVIFALGFTLAAFVFKRDASESILLAMSGVVANNAFYVLPIALQLYGPEAAKPFVAITALDGLFAFSAAILALGLIRRGRVSVGALAAGVAGSPIILALMAGFAFAATGWTMPAPFGTFLAFNGVAAAPVALFALGVALSKTVFRAEPAVLVFVGIKLLVFPAAVWFALDATFYAADDAPVYVLAAAGPSVAMSFSLALLHDVRTDTIAQIMVWTGLLSLVSIAVLA